MAARGRASVAFSGGGTPGPMFDALVTLDVPWSEVEVFQVDERVAPDGDPVRNATQLRERLLAPARIPTRRVHLMPVTASNLARAAAQHGRAVGARTPFDVVHLGIGDDGHTASWPPGDDVIDSEKAVDLSVVYQGRRRMTLTPPIVNGARSRVFLITEGSKAAVVARWIDAADPHLPVTRVHRTNTDVVLDRSAATALSRSSI